MDRIFMYLIKIVVKSKGTPYLYGTALLLQKENI